MSELKTLKDLWIGLDSDDFSKSIRQEAIKWIKELDKYTVSYGKNHPIFKNLENNGDAQLILKIFFNLTEEDINQSPQTKPTYQNGDKNGATRKETPTHMRDKTADTHSQETDSLVTTKWGVESRSETRKGCGKEVTRIMGIARYCGELYICEECRNQSPDIKLGESQAPKRTPQDVEIAQGKLGDVSGCLDTSESKIEAHTKVSIEAYDRGVLDGRKQAIADVFKELRKEIKKNKDELTFGGYSIDVINEVEKKLMGEEK